MSGTGDIISGVHRRLAVVLLLFVACTSQPPASPRESVGESKGGCPPTETLIADSTKAERAAYRAGLNFVDAVSKKSYNPHVAWRMLNPWFVHYQGWSGLRDFMASDQGRPYPLAGINVSDEAMLVSEVGGQETLPHREYRDFLLARAGVTPTACSEDVRNKLAESLWYLTLTPVDGNAPAYVLLVHTRTGYSVLSSDI